jgi:hypothetical protein
VSADATVCNAGCGRPGVHRCAYEDDEGRHCESTWCDEHVQRVGGIPVCRRHKHTLEIIASRRDSVYELGSRPAVADRSLSLAVHLAEVLNASVAGLLERELEAWPGGHVESERHPRPFWDEFGKLAGWELGWSIQSPRGHHLRVAVRARVASGDPSVQVIAEQAVAYDGEPAPEAVRGRQTEAQALLLREIESLLTEALQRVPTGWRQV